MPNIMEHLAIEIDAESSRAYKAIDNLAGRFDKLSKAASGLETGKILDLANALTPLGQAIRNLNDTTSKRDFNKIFADLQLLSAISLPNLPSVSQGITQFAASLNGIAAVSSSIQAYVDLANALSKFGGAAIGRAITNIPLLGDALVKLIESINKAPAVSQNIIDFTNALTNLASQGQKVSSATKGITNGIKSFNSVATTSTKKARTLASAIGMMYAKYALVIRGIKKLYDSVTSTADYLEAYNYYNVTFDKIADEWKIQFKDYGYENAEEYANSFTERIDDKFSKMSGLTLNKERGLIEASSAKSLGLNLTEITQYASGIASITNAIGLTGETSLATSKALTMLAGDLGSLKNLDYETVSANLQSALTGQARALYKYGIDVTNATLETYAYAAGVEKSVSKMTQAEKAQLRLLAILDQSKVSWGDLANTINSPSNMLRQLKNNLAEVGTVLGQLFIPVLSKTLPYINGVAIALKRLLVNIADFLGIRLDLEDFSQGYSDGLEGLEEDLDDVADASKKATKGIRAFDELNVISSKNSGADKAVGQIDLTAQILDAVSDYEKVWDEAYERMASKASEIADVISDSLAPIGKIIEDFAIGDFFQAGTDVSALIVSITDFVTDAINGVDWEKLGENIGNFLSGIDWAAIFKGVLNVVDGIVRGLMDAYDASYAVAPLETAIITAIGVFKFLNLGDKLKDKIPKAIEKKLKTLGKSALAIGAGITISMRSFEAICESSNNEVWEAVKMAAGNALVGAGLAKAISVFSGLSMGALLPITLGAALGLTLLEFAIAKDKQKEAEFEQEKQKLLEDLGITDMAAKITQVDIDRKAIEEDLEAKLSEITIKDSVMESMASKYLQLSANYASLTDEEKALLEYYSEQLSNAYPEITEHINSITKAWEGTKEQLMGVIDKQKELHRLNAYGESLEEQYKLEAKAVKNLKDSEQKLWNTRSDQTDAEIKFNQMLQKWAEIQHENLRERYGYSSLSVNELKAKALEALKEDPFATSIRYNTNTWLDLDNDSLNIQQAYEDFLNLSNAVKETERNFESAQEVLNNVQNNITEYETILEDAAIKYYGSGYSSGSNYSQGVKDGMEDGKPEVENKTNEIFDMLDTALEGIEDGKLKEDVKKAMNAVKKQINSGKQPSITSLQNLYNSLNKAFNKLPEGKLPKNMKSTMDKISEKIRAGSPDATGAILELVEALAKTLEGVDYKDKFGKFGTSIWKAIKEQLEGDFNLSTITIDDKGKFVFTQGDITPKMPTYTELDAFKYSNKTNTTSTSMDYSDINKTADDKNTSNSTTSNTTSNTTEIIVEGNENGMLNILTKAYNNVVNNTASKVKSIVG